MKRLILTTVMAALVGTLPGLVNAGDEQAINADMPRRAPGSTSGSGDTVEANCPTDPSGNAWQGATANLKVAQAGGSSSVTVRVKGAVPDTVFTVWLRMKGNGPDGSQIGGSPITGGGATPVAPGYALDNLIHYTSPLPGTSNPTNGFTTDRNGNANFKIDLDFPVVGGAYPFQAASQAAIDVLDAARAANGQGPIPGVRIPSPVVNPADANISGPFLMRVISHCTDQLGHGLSPATREAWFQYP